MPKETPTPIARGQGSVSPDFTAPVVGVAQPGRQLTAPATNEEAFRDTILAFGQGVASAVSARAAIANRIKSLKETSMNKVEDDLNRAARSFQARRIERVHRDRQDILVEAGEKGMEWAEREFRNRMTNAASGEEAQIWEQAWGKAVVLTDRENAEAERQSFNQAKMTMQEVGISLSQELQESPDLVATLKGDGKDINARVQDWMLTRVQSAVDMDNLSNEDAQFLIHQTIVQASRIGDQLRDQHGKDIQDSNARLGARQMEADVFSTLTGDQDPKFIEQQIEVSLRDRFSHLTLEQQDDMVRQMVSSNLQKLANGDFGIEHFGGIENAARMLNMDINGRKVFNEGERLQLANKMYQMAERTIGNEMEARLTQERERFSTVVTLADGTQVTKPNLNADAMLIKKDPDTGVSPLDRIADKVLREINPNVGPEDARLVGVVRQLQSRMEQSTSTAVNKQQNDWARVANYLSGNTTERPTEDGNLTYHIIPETKATLSPLELRANNRGPVSDQEDAHLRNSYKELAALTGMDPSIVDQWNGEPIDTAHPLRPIADMAQARLFNQPGVEMPPALVRNKLALLTSDDPNDLKSFGTFAMTLDGGVGGAWQKFLQSKMSDSERAQAIHTRTTMRLGRADYDADGNPVIQTPSSEATDMNFLHSQVQALSNTPNMKDWITARPDGDSRQPRNVDTLAAALTQMVRDDDDPRMYGRTAWESNNEELAAGIVNAITNDSALAQWVGSIMQSQSALDAGLDETQIAATVKSWLDRDGIRFKQLGEGSVVLFQDPANHTGPPGQNITEHAQEKLLTPYPAWARSVIGEALGAKPHEIPETPQGLYLFRRKGQVFNGELLLSASRDLTVADMRVAGVLRAEYGNTAEDAQRRLDRREEIGGAILHATTSTGDRLQVPTATHRVEFTYPDGTPGVIEEGQVIAFVNSDFTPSSEPKPRQRQGGFVVDNAVGEQFRPVFSGQN